MAFFLPETQGTELPYTIEVYLIKTRTKTSIRYAKDKKIERRETDSDDENTQIL